ncbi:MAG: DUF1552 domain-containing protein [Myxococcota bacterium]
MNLGRRRLLQGLGASLGTIPLLGSIPSQAGGGEFPKRLLFFYSPNNSIDRFAWTPDGEGSEFALPDALPEMLSPLDDFRDNLLVVGNLVMNTRDKETGPGGHVGMGHQLTGWANNPWPDQGQESEYWAGGISVDQFVANDLGSQALTLAANPRGTNGGCRISYTGADEPVHPYENPLDAFNAIFGDADVGVDEQQAGNARQLLALEQVAREVDRLRPKVASDDRDKLDKHLEHVAALSDDLQSFVPADCEPTAPPEVDAGAASQHPVIGRAHMDVLAQAVACGVTRVGSIQNGNTGNAENYSGTLNWPSEGISFDRSQHVIAHDYEQDTGNATFLEQRMTVEKFYVSQYAYLLDKLRSIPEGDGTVLDNTLVVWTKGMGRGHSKDRLLYLLAGGSGFPELNPGRFLDRTDVPHNDMLVTIANLMGVDIDTFGDPELCTGAMAL